MALLNPGGHNWGPELNFDVLGIFYIAFAIIYTLVVCYGLFALFCLRHTHAVRIRCFSIIGGTVACLHVYLLLILLVYPLNGRFKCGWEFWIMSILLPWGIAMFQASNVRLYSYAKEQKDVAAGKHVGARHIRWKWRGTRPIQWLRYDTVESRTYVAICVGLTVQLVVVLTLFFGSYKFHSSYGFFSQHVSAAQCRRGYEWIPSVLWQASWAIIFGPWILLRIRKIQDTHYWAWQTRLAIMACLPGTPLWLIFTYGNAPILTTINSRFPPSGWFLPGLFMIQFVTILFPLLDVHKLQTLESQFGRNRDGYENELPIPEKPRNPYSMATLELQLSKNPSNLLYWAYTKEFTAENIMFLTSVRDFKRNWEQTMNQADNLTTLQQRERFEEAAIIYFKLVDPQTARMNINIDYKTFNELRELFKDCHYAAVVDDSSSCSKSSSCYTENVVTPWDNYDRPLSANSRDSGRSKVNNDNIDKLYTLPVTEILAKDYVNPGACVEREIRIPGSFCVEVFDRAYEAVKNDVYLNTWVRYEARYARPRSPSHRRSISRPRTVVSVVA